MAGEASYLDYKVDFDPDNEKAKLDLVKNIVAISNSGGGQIIFGRDEINSPGLDGRTISALDSARISDLVEKYTKPAVIELSHDLTELENQNFLCTIQISPAEYPVVMSKTGDWKGMNNRDRDNKPVFLKGDVWIRHSTKTERVSYEDIRSWIEQAKQMERDKILKRINTYVNLPEGSDIKIISPSGRPIDGPSSLLANAIVRRDLNDSHLLSPADLLWLYLDRDRFEPTKEELALIVASSLRRNSTLFWWLTKAESFPGLIMSEVNQVLDSSDRDKSDAANSMVEVAAIYGENEEIDRLLQVLSASRYAHFQEAAKKWNGRESQLLKTRKRIINVKNMGRSLLDLPIPDLESGASSIARIVISKRNQKLSKKLADINRIIWVKRSRYGNQVLNIKEG